MVRSKKQPICGETFMGPDGKVYVCQRPKHTIWPSAKHWDHRDGSVSWSEGAAAQQRQQGVTDFWLNRK